MKIRRVLFACLAVTFAAPALAQVNQTFTYQGRLDNAGAPATGTYDMRFRLYTASAAGSQIGSTLCVDNVPVANGFFDTSLNFGDVYNGSSRWLEIEVRPDTGLSCANVAGFTIMGPRQNLTATPFASYALNANNLDGYTSTDFAFRGFTNTFSATQFISTTGIDPLNITSSSTAGTRIDVSNTSSSRTFSFYATGTASPEGSDRFAIRDNTAGVSRLLIDSTGRVGIGTTTPNSSLNVEDGTLQISSSAAGSGNVSVLVTGNEMGRVTTANPNGTFACYLGESQVNPADGGQVVVDDENGVGRGALQMNGNNCVLIAQVKNFMVSNPDDASTEIYYACVEGPEAAMYVRGTAALVNGRATVSLPRHFTAMLSDVSTMTVQITPLSADCNGLAVTRKGADSFDVAELMRGMSASGFDWEVKAVRAGFESYKVIRPAGLLTPKAHTAARR